MRKLIVIPQTQYQQLIQNQTTTAATVCKETGNEGNICPSTENTVSGNFSDEAVPSQENIGYHIWRYRHRKTQQYRGENFAHYPEQFSSRSGEKSAATFFVYSYVSK